MPYIIKQFGRPVRARGLDGENIEREDRLFMDSENQWYETLDYDNHFIYKTSRMGTSFLCTCGSPAAVFGYDAYKKYSSRYKGNFVLGCIAHLNDGAHADGSH